MKQKIVKFLAVIFILVLALPVVALAEGMGTSMTTPASTPSSTPADTTQTPAVNISLIFDKTPVKTGENSFKVVVEDSNKQPVTGAVINTTFDMDRNKMDTMGMKDPIVVTLIEAKPGEYTGIVDLSKNGDWLAKSVLSINGKDANSEYDFTVQNAGPNLLVIGGFVGAIVIIVGIVLITKKKGSKNEEV